MSIDQPDLDFGETKNPESKKEGSTEESSQPQNVSEESAPTNSIPNEPQVAAPQSGEMADDHIRKYVEENYEKIVHDALAVRKQRGLTYTEALRIYLEEKDFYRFVNGDKFFELVGIMNKEEIREKRPQKREHWLDKWQRDNDQ